MFDLLSIKSRPREIDWHRVIKLCASILIEHGEGVPLPCWLTSSMLERMDKLKTKAWSWLVDPKEIRLAKEIRKLLIGVFLHELKTKLENFENEADTKKLNLYETVGD